ncbi:hypothetical protein AAMO2058_000098200 [Amorphochlora amoebiformis]
MRVLFIHGGGSTSRNDRTKDPYAIYLREELGEDFYMVPMRFTHDFEWCIKTQAKAVKDFQPDVIVGRSQGGPTVLSLIHRGYWSGPSLLCCPAIVPGVDNLNIPSGIPVVVLAGNHDEQVPYSRIIYFCQKNLKRLGSASFEWKTNINISEIEKYRAANPEPKKDRKTSEPKVSNPASEPREDRNSSEPKMGRILLRELVERTWAKRLTVPGYDHSKRFPRRFEEKNPKEDKKRANGVDGSKCVCV